jgi:acid stress chaperone HdeB
MTWVIALPVAAVSFDMGDATCADLGSIEDSETVTFLLIWLDGYLSGVTGDTTFDSDFLVDFTDALVEACAANPESPLVDVTEEVGTAE